MAEPRDIIIFSIGPVQSYISAARRTQDLRTASQILSLLARSAISTAINLGCEVVYPQNKSIQRGIPNRLVFFAPTGQGRSIAGKVKEGIENQRNDLSARVQKYLQSRMAAYDHILWQTQVEDWLEIYWVSIPWDGEEQHYREQLCIASLALDGRKGLRKYPATIEKQQTCSLCGLRSSLGGKDYWKALDLSDNIIRPSEVLCALCTIKRLLPVVDDTPVPAAGFPSTATIASASYQLEVDHFAKTIGDVEIIQAFNQLAEANSSINLRFPEEGALYFPEYYQVATIQRDTGKIVDRKVLINAKNAIRSINKRLAKLGSTVPHANPYYAILLMDGDHMGKLLDRLETPSQHQAVSAILADLSQEASDTVTGNLGHVVYSGGDDLLALLPVSTVLDTAYQIQKAFRQKFELGSFPGQSMSAGIAIAHYGSPMQQAILSAQAAERAAKTRCDRDALVLQVAKRSGEIRQVAWKWHAANGELIQVNQLEALIKAIATGDLSGKFAYELWEERSALAESDDNPSAGLFEKELYRLLKRHSKDGWKSESERKILASEISRLWDFMPYSGISRAEQITQWLVVARFLAEGERE